VSSASLPWERWAGHAGNLNESFVACRRRFARGRRCCQQRQDICRSTVARNGFTTGMARGPVPSGARPRSRHRRWRAACSKLACRRLQHGEATSDLTTQYLRVPDDGNARIAFAWPTPSGAGAEGTVTVVRGPLSAAGSPRKATISRFASWSAVRNGHRQQRFTYRAALRGSVRIASVGVNSAPNHSEQMLGIPLGENRCGATSGLRASHSVRPATVERGSAEAPFRGNHPCGRLARVERRQRIQESQLMSWRGNDRRASGTERCTAPREGKALKGAIPRALPARNKAGTARDGV